MSATLISSVGLVLVRFEWAVLVYFALANAFYALLLLVASRELTLHLQRIWHENRSRLLGSRLAPSVSVIAPAYNEEATIDESVRALLTLHYANLEVVVVNDGSSDDTLDVLRKRFDLVPVHNLVWRRIDTKPVRALYRSRTHPNLLVADKVNGGKADALNVGLNLATGDLVCAIDADTLIEADALQRMVRPFLSDDSVVAAGGTIRVVNGSVVHGGRVTEVRVPRRLLAGVQTVEYLRAFFFGRLGWNGLGGNLVISGAFGLFRCDAVIDVGGYTDGTVGEDMELVLKLRRRAYERGTPCRIEFIPDCVAWTEVPESLRALGRQRDRWHRGLADVLVRHRAMLLNPRYGSAGLLALPYFVFVELLGPLVELLGLVGLATAIALGVLDTSFALLFFAVAYGLGLLMSAAAILLEELGFHRHRRLRDRFLLIAWALVEGIGYRPLTVVWRLRGLVRFLLGRTDWGRMERRGFQPPASASTLVPRT